VWQLACGAATDECRDRLRALPRRRRRRRWRRPGHRPMLEARPRESAGRPV